MAEDEIIVLQAVFCSDGEFELLSSSVSDSDQPSTFRITLKFEPTAQSEQQAKIDITFTLPSNYPETIPEISIASTTLTRDACQRLRSDLLQYAGTLDTDPMIMMLIDWTKDHWKEYIIMQAKKTCEEKMPYKPTEITVAILHIDHMRSKVKYTKTIVKWAEELQLSGRLIFYNNLILVLLEGFLTAIKEFIVRLHTQKVDVDSAGRSCKERMSRVLVEQSHPSPHKRNTHFEVLECTSLANLEDVFRTSDLLSIYRTDLVPEFKFLH